jgi:hypothetical protein
MAYTLDDIGNAPGQAYDFLKRKYVSLTKPDEDGNYSSRKSSIARQQKLAEALSQMGAQEEEVSTVGGITAPVSGMGALARGLTSFGGSYLSGKAAADEAAANKAARAEAIEARKTFNQEPDLVMPGGSARLTPTPGSNNAIPASPELPKYILQDDEAMAAGPQRSDATLRPFDIMPKEQDVTFGDIISKVGKRSKEDQSRLLDEYEMSDNPYLQNLSQRLRSESKGEMFEGNKAGVYRMNADGSIETLVPGTTEAADRAPFTQLLIDRDALIAKGAKPDDPRVQALDAKIRMETTRSPGVSISMGDQTNKVLQGLDTQDLGDYRTKRTAAQTMLSTIQDLKSIDPAKLYTGSLADLKTTFSGYVNAAGLGGVDLDKLANSETYQASLANLGIKLVKSLGANPTDTDLKFIMSSLPLLTKQPKARAELLAFLEQRARSDIKNYDSAVTYYKKNNSLSGFAPTGGMTASGIPTSGFNE